MMSDYGILTHRDAIALYKAMRAAAKILKPADLAYLRYPQTNPDDKIRVYNGFMKSLGPELGMNESKVNALMKHLYRVEAITNLSRSTPLQGGVWILNYEPTLEQLKDQAQKARETDRQVNPSRYDIVLTELYLLRERVSRLEKRLNDADNLRGSASLS